MTHKCSFFGFNYGTFIKYKKHASSKLLLFDTIEISYAFLLSKLFYERAKFSDC